MDTEINVDDLLDKDYDYVLINQILKAWEKGYDITKIDRNINVNKLREIVNSLEYNNGDRGTEQDLVEIYLELYDIKLNKTITNQLPACRDLLSGIFDGINPKAYEFTNTSHPNIKRMNQVGRDCLKLNIDITDYLTKGYNTGQIEEILNSIKKGYDLTNIIDNSYDYDRIKALNILIDYYKKEYLAIDEMFKKIAKQKFTNKIMNKIVKCLDSRINIDIIFDETYSTRQRGIFLTALSQDLDITNLKNPLFTSPQMNIIMVGEQKGYDTSIYANPEFDEKQMHSIYEILKYNEENLIPIDVSLVLNPKISPLLMDRCLNAYKNDDMDEKIKVYEEINKIQKITKDCNEVER